MHLQPGARLVVVALVASLSTVQIGAQARPSGPAPGELVDIGGRKMHLQCAGPRDASPAIVLLPGGGASSSTWSRVQGLLANEKTCAYDPPGTGWSDAASVPRTLRQEAFDLNRLLQRAHLEPPFILVGHSIGGAVARTYAAEYPGVSSIVLVDALHEDSTQFNTIVNRWVRVRDSSTGKIVPEPAIGTVSPTNPSDDFLADELQLLHDDRTRRTATLGDMPLFVILAGRRERIPGTSDSFWTALMAERDAQGADLVRLSNSGVLIRAEQSGHNVQTDEPEVVARTIRMALDAVKDGAASVQRP